MLPHEFLFDLGSYLQTAAHIELAVWTTTVHADGVDLQSADQHREYAAIKISTHALLERFRKSAANCPDTIADRIKTLADEISIGLEPRNMAAHGAFFPNVDSPGTLGTAHYFARGRGKERQIFEATQTITRSDVENALNVADQLLTDIIKLREDVCDWRYPDGIPENQS